MSGVLYIDELAVEGETGDPDAEIIQIQEKRHLKPRREPA